MLWNLPLKPQATGCRTRPRSATLLWSGPCKPQPPSVRVRGAGWKSLLHLLGLTFNQHFLPSPIHTWYAQNHHLLSGPHDWECQAVFHNLLTTKDTVYHFLLHSAMFWKIFIYQALLLIHFQISLFIKYTYNANQFFFSYCGTNTLHDIYSLTKF